MSHINMGERNPDGFDSKVLLLMNWKFVQGRGIVISHSDLSMKGEIVIPFEEEIPYDALGPILNGLGQISNRDIQRSGIIDNSVTDPVGSILESITSIKTSIADIAAVIKK